MKRLSYYMTLLAAVLLAACASDEPTDNEQPLPEGMGRIRLTVCMPENLSPTRAVSTTAPWIVPDHEWEKVQSFRILICDTENKVVQIKTGSTLGNTSTSTSDYPYQWVTVTSDALEAGTYRIYATANYADGYEVGSTVDLDATVKFANGYGFSNDTPIPMTGRLTTVPGGSVIKEVGVSNGVETDLSDPTNSNYAPLTLWRIMGKLQFDFANYSGEQVKIRNIVVEPLNMASSSGPGIYLFSKDDLTSKRNLSKYVSATWPLHDATLQTNATLSEMGKLSQATLTVGNGLTQPATSQLTAQDGAQTKMQMFQPVTSNEANRNENATITFTVTPNSGLTFKPKSLSFTASRVGTDGGKFDVMAGGTWLATGVTPNRSNRSPFISTYLYDLSDIDATTGSFTVKLYIYSLANNKQFAFSDVVITGEVYPTGDTAEDVITLPAGARTDVGAFDYTVPSGGLTLNALDGTTPGTGTAYFYVNETDATYTSTENQLSLRFKIERGGSVEEVRYALTTPYTTGLTGGDGFNVIRRNDWIHIPVALTDWQFRVEPIAFVPIAGYPAVVLSSDALTATFSTGGYFILQPFAQKTTDGIWRDFSDPEVTFVSMTMTGDTQMFETAPVYDSTTQRITGVLDNDIATGTYKTTLTINVKLGPSTGTQYPYSFTCNVVLQK